MTAEEVGAPDGGWGWIVALGAALVQMQVERLKCQSEYAAS